MTKAELIPSATGPPSPGAFLDEGQDKAVAAGDLRGWRHSVTKRVAYGTR